MTGGGLLGDPWDSIVAGTGAILFLWLAMKIVTSNPERKIGL